jgi:hypothetical protein
MDEDEETPPKSRYPSDKMYKLIKFLILIGIPSIGTLYFIAAEIWGFGSGQQILGALMTLEAILGILLGIVGRMYNNSEARFSGSLNVTETSTKILYSLELNHAPEELKEKDEAIFKVKKIPPE